MCDVFAPLVDAADQDADLSQLREGLVARATRAGELDVAYRRVDTPLGALLVAASPVGVARVAFESEGHDAVLDSLAARLGSRVLAARAALDEPARQLDEYFTGRRRAFDVPLDLRLSSGFRLEVLRALPGISYGTTASYAQVAAAAGSPRAVRAVGTACATNPLPVLVPCHRVVRSDGSRGAYLGGVAAKNLLLDLEGAPTA